MNKQENNTFVYKKCIYYDGGICAKSEHNLWCKNINAHCQQRMITELQQQTAELQQNFNELKHRLEYYKEKTTQLLDDIDNKDRFNTELQEQLNNIQDDCPYFKDCSYRQCDKDRIDKYKQVFDEIEKIVKQTCNQRCTNDCLGTRKHCGYGSVLNVINKAKDGE